MSPSQYTLSPLTDELSYRSLPGVREYVVHSDARILTSSSMAFLSSLAILSYALVSILSLYRVESAYKSWTILTFVLSHLSLVYRSAQSPGFAGLLVPSL
jgi:hypothetical protein